MEMTLEEQGAYRNLLDEAWLRGGTLPIDERILAKACGDATRWKRVRGSVLGKFRRDGESWRNDTLDEVLAESVRRADKQRRWRLMRGNASSNADGNTSGNGAGNQTGNEQRLEVGNKLHSPDPDPDIERVKNTRSTARARVDFVNGTTDEELATRAAELLTRFDTLFSNLRHGARYRRRPALDFPRAVELCQTWEDDAHLDKLAVIVLTTDDEWVSGTDRGFGVFAARASWADGLLRTYEAAQQLKESR